jgi:peptidoglycan/LPS O-acetylase OafA/YrhL
MQRSNQENNEFKGLNVIRFFCFLIVFLMHCNVLTGNIYIDTILLKAYPRFHIGVSFFFILSAFLLTNLALQEISNKKFSFKNFFIRRGLRIYPLYFFLYYLFTICYLMYYFFLILKVFSQCPIFGAILLLPITTKLKALLLCWTFCGQ